MRTVEIEVFSIDELEGRAKEKALDEYRYINVEDSHWYEFLVTRIVKDLIDLGYSVKGEEAGFHFSGFSSQGDGASFEAFVDLDVVADRLGLADKVARVREEHEDFEVIIVRNPNSRYFHHMTMHEEVHPWYLPKWGAMPSDNVRHIAHDLGEEILQDAREQAQAAWVRLRDEYEYQTADEQVEESILANALEFREDGTRHF